MNRNLTASRSRLSQSAWPLVSLLLIAVTAPAASVLWFMTQAMRNEQLAVQTQMETLYRGQLLTLSERLDDFWEEQLAVFARAADGDDQPSEIFAEFVRVDLADGLIVTDSDSNVLYPADGKLTAVEDESEQGLWLQAWDLEHHIRDDVTAIQAYSTIAEDAVAAENWNVVASALLGKARCLARSGNQMAALEFVNGDLLNLCGDATDQQGNLILPNAQLWALKTLVPRGSAEFQLLLQNLKDRLNDYKNSGMPASQRRFLMSQLKDISPHPIEFQTLDAEVIAERILNDPRFSSSRDGKLKLLSFGTGNIWGVTEIGEQRSVTALYLEANLQKRLQAFLEKELVTPNAVITLTPPDNELPEETIFLAEPAGQYLSDWQLSLTLDGTDPFASMAKGQIATYFYSGISVVLLTVVVGGFVARYVGSQIRTTRLRNDLIATVTHELKTPLASMRALIETLLDGRYNDSQQQREYLELAAKENERLSRLIDNFLAFSRMERNKRTFEFQDVNIDEIVTTATAATREEFQSSRAELEINIETNLPKVKGDADALTTVLIDLLDNAIKYTGESKKIQLRAFSRNGHVFLEVEDNGLGLSRRATKRVFDRFYQVDDSLSRRVGGCGLGLSIVKFIVTSHGGTVGVSSQLGQGSTFSVTLPAMESTSSSPGKNE